MELLGGKTIMEHVIRTCQRSAIYIAQTYKNPPIRPQVLLLCPHGDPLVRAFEGWVDIVEGDEKDVLSRYAKAVDIHGPADFVCRITGDCPLIPDYVISKVISIAVKNRYDYVSNVDPQCRSSEDGLDCEVMSGAMLAWINNKARTTYDREHVTTMITRDMPAWAKMGAVIGYFDRSAIKLSVDTPEDLEIARSELAKISKVESLALKKYGKRKVHRL
jgi:spore coat polysaccharide biosynthesis protein SpsF (cytidylyltransferase family)